ncbi:hypothetical protein JHJ32_13235 [Parapedobacter sp. ISTM3]|uniref:hypothetical protein n=1 Tax=Parapedobacter sp. ISTM3 TaxID=2800130 RepID=UPI0019032A07|nr:hypothetical protein [Parapedobacter sp. ISTM3]MBK1440957.1 hypothetical protein [Parapedobacter sp. ISTM3]
MLKSILLAAPRGTIPWSGGRIALDVSMLLCTLLAFVFSGSLLRQLDATAAPFDVGLLSAGLCRRRGAGSQLTGPTAYNSVGATRYRCYG